jgi:transposase
MHLGVGLLAAQRQQVGALRWHHLLDGTGDPVHHRQQRKERLLAQLTDDVVAELDLAPFLRAYRADGHGHPAYDPKTLLGVLLYAYATGVRSSRQIQRCCTEDLAFRVLAGNQLPDHVTIARFRVRHQQALAGFLVESLKLCAAAGLVHLGVIALDGTKVAANAADRANCTLAKLEEEVAEILREAAEADQAEDHQHGPMRGDGFPAELASPSGRLARLRQARARLRQAKARLEAEVAERQRRYQQRVAELAAAARAKGRQPRAHIRPRPRDGAPNPGAVANSTDPDGRFLHTRNGTVQGYNAQAVVTEHQVVVAAALTREANDLQQLAPMLAAVDQALASAEIPDRPGMLLADSATGRPPTSPPFPMRPSCLSGRPALAAPASPARTASPRRPAATGCAPRCSPSSPATRAEPITPNASRPWSRCSGSSRSSRAPAGSCDGAWRLVRRSGSCCAAPTTCSSSGATRTAKPHQRRWPPERRRSASRRPRRPTPTAGGPATRPQRGPVNSPAARLRHRGETFQQHAGKRQ